MNKLLSTKKILFSAKSYDIKKITKEIIQCVPEYSPSSTYLNKNIKKINISDR